MIIPIGKKKAITVVARLSDNNLSFGFGFHWWGNYCHYDIRLYFLNLNIYIGYDNTARSFSTGKK
jgi:hypothetical protein